MTNWDEVLEPQDEVNCKACEYYDHDDGCCSAFQCNPFDCGKLPCEEEMERRGIEA